MRQIKEYIVVIEWQLSKLEDKVNRYIEDGYYPQGGVSTDRVGNFTQAMVKYHEEMPD